MASKRTDIDAITVTLDENGTATLSGLNYQDLRNILTAASLYAYDQTPDIKPLEASDYPDITHENNKQTMLFHLHRRHVLEVIEDRLNVAIRPEYHRSGVEGMKRLFALQRAELDETVRDAERKAAEQASVAAGQAPHPADVATEALRKALADAQTAMAALQQARKG